MVDCNSKLLFVNGFTLVLIFCFMFVLMVMEEIANNTRANSGVNETQLISFSSDLLDS